MRKIFLLLSVFLLVACGGESATATPEPTETPLPTNTTAPTDTPLPTDTPTPLPTDTPTPVPTDTPTPMPTDTPVPTDTPTPLPTDTLEPSPTPEMVEGPLSLDEYAVELAAVYGPFPDALTTLGALLGDIKLDDQDWVAEAATQIVTIREVYEGMAGLEPPEEILPVHTAFVDAIGACNDATYHLVDGLDNLDADEMDKASELMIDCGEKLVIATDMLNEFSETGEVVAAPPAEPPAEELPSDVFVEIEGQGETVTDNFEWPACEKAIFYWSVAPGSYGSASLILKLHTADGTDEASLVNEFQTDMAGNLEGAALRPLLGGEYYFSSENTDEMWTVRGECHDGQPPVATGADLTGEGNQVTGNYELPACQKSVFFWTAEADGGNASLIAKLHKVGSDRTAFLVNEFEMDVPEGISGSALQPLTGGEYYFSTENVDAGWTIRWECQDDQAPIGTEIDLTGVGNMVTGNYELPACDKSVFVWSTEPNDSGTASLILHLFKVGSDQYASLANGLEMDLTEPLTGEALQPLSGGVYYLTTENTNGPWSVRWECRD